MSFHLPTAQVKGSVFLHFLSMTLCREAAELQEAESVHLEQSWRDFYLYPGISVVCLDDLIRHHLHAKAMSRVRNRQAVQNGKVGKFATSVFPFACWFLRTILELYKKFIRFQCFAKGYKIQVDRFMLLSCLLQLTWPSFWTRGSLYCRPISLFVAYTVFCGFVTACRLAGSPTRRSPLSVKATTEGVVRAPSAFSMTLAACRWQGEHITMHFPFTRR